METLLLSNAIHTPRSCKTPEAIKIAQLPCNAEILLPKTISRYCDSITGIYINKAPTIWTSLSNLRWTLSLINRDVPCKLGKKNIGDCVTGDSTARPKNK